METISDLLKKLEEKYGERLSYNPLEVLSGAINGTIDGKRVIISCGSDFLIISVAHDGKEIIDELMPILKKSMRGQEPICSYDMPCENCEAMPTIEWDLVSPDERIENIVNGRAYAGVNKVGNLVLFNGKDISSYEETEEVKAAIMASAKISGIYPGCFTNSQGMDEITELELYFLIDTIGGLIWGYRHKMKHGIIPYCDLSEEQFALEYLVYQTTRFGVTMPEPSYGRSVEPTPSYRAWFRFYDSHFKAMDEETLQSFNNAYAKGEDITAYLPKGKWQDLLEDTKLQP